MAYLKIDYLGVALSVRFATKGLNGDWCCQQYTHENKRSFPSSKVAESGVAMKSLNHKKWRNQPNAYRGEYSSQYEISEMADFVGKGIEQLLLKGLCPRAQGFWAPSHFFWGLELQRDRISVNHTT